MASPYLELPARDPLAPQTRHFQVARHLQRIAGHAGNPGIADLLRHHRQPLAVRFDGIGDVREIGGGHLCVGELLPQAGVDSVNFLDGMRTAVIAPAFHIDGQIRSGNLDDAAVVMMIEHHQVAAGGIFPQKDRRNIRHGARRIGADIEKLYSVLGEWANDGARVAGHVGHFRAGGGAPEAPVHRLRKTDAAGNQRRVHHLRLPGEGKRVPGNVPG